VARLARHAPGHGARGADDSRCARTAIPPPGAVRAADAGARLAEDLDLWLRMLDAERASPSSPDALHGASIRTHAMRSTLPAERFLALRCAASADCCAGPRLTLVAGRASRNGNAHSPAGRELRNLEAGDLASQALAGVPIVLVSVLRGCPMARGAECGGLRESVDFAFVA